MPQTNILPLFPAAGAARPGSPSPALVRRMARYTLSDCGPEGARRAELEGFIRHIFHSKHGAQVNGFLPTFLELRDRTERLCAVLGIRSAAQGRLFLEHYLDAPIEQQIAREAGRPVDRASIVEVGNLAATSCRAARVLASRLPRRLLDAGHRWIAFTGTRVVREILASLDAPVLDLGPADPARLPGGAAEWGSYYDNEPRVFAAYLPNGLALASFATDGNA